MIKLIIYDLDDTLYDCSGKITYSALKRAAGVISKQVGKSQKFILTEIFALYDLHGPKTKVFNLLAKKYNIKNPKQFVELAMASYNAPFIPPIKPFPFAKNTLKTLKKKGIKTVLVSYGNKKRQEKKIHSLKLEKVFDKIFISSDESKSIFKNILFDFNVRASEALVIGDKIFSEIACANRLGITSVQYVHGKYKSIYPKNKFEVPDHRINSHSQLLPLIENINTENAFNPKIVVIGGGTGLPKVLSAMRKYTKNITGIVTVMDSGASSGKIRDEFDTIAFGDLRNCLAALSNSQELCQLFQYRFKKGSLKGHSLGNLFLFALSDILGNPEKAVESASEILEITGSVLPSTYDNINLCAILSNGKIIKKESYIEYRKDFLVPIKEVFLSPSAKASKKALNAISEADLIVIGPGGWYSSVVSNLLVSGICTAIRKSSAKTIILPNIMSQAGQTHNYKLSDYLLPIYNLLKIKVDLVIFNNKKPSKKQLIAYRKTNSFPVENDHKKTLLYANKIIKADLIEDESTANLEKPEWLRHDPNKIAKNIISILK